MDIKYIGHSSFIIKTRQATLVTDPYSPDIGMKYPKTAADIVTLSHDHADHANTKGIDGTPVVLDWPGEYEIKGIAVVGIPTYHDDQQGALRGPNVCYKIIGDGVSILHLGDLGHKLDDRTVEQIGSVDIVMVPVGGHYTIDAATAAQVVKQIDPYIAIPMHYGHQKLNQKTFSMLTPVADFVQAMGQTDIQAIPKLSIKHEELTSYTTTKVVTLEMTA